ncbi:NADPH-dependent FMN reductase [Sediminibacterium ginsengisoli]|uniref:NAD(P)H-dependent FMN reductase n=1 Tax=Sediminibacterium ginsengisoli TaxID=413434 RepID=A0A1T4Q0K9_9BACT|nr:NAD(P)H-dependent oxidoreductase [Sediminibacterium ginsengisoli]SJZ97041.1 NAD(P)H-dependent FMN reductase [Sediminibacterium ginsengisoli]
METKIRLAGISGSLRKDSFNTALLRTAATLLPEDVTMEILPIGDLPLYNGDLDVPAVQQRPEPVNIFREGLKRAQGLVIVSPEYNYSIPGVLKNAMDWASRGEDSPVIKKPVALMGATPGLWGTVRMQVAFQPLFLTLAMPVIYKPEVLVAGAEKKFTAGKLTDETAIEMVKKKLAALTDHIRKNSIA